MAHKSGARVRSSAFTARLRGTVDRVAATPTAHRFYGDSFLLVRFDHGLTMWVPVKFATPAPKDFYDGFRKDASAGWRSLVPSAASHADPAGLAGLQLWAALAQVCSAHSHVRSDQRLAGLWMEVPMEEAAELLLRLVEPLVEMDDAISVSPPAKPFDRGDFKGFTEIRCRDLLFRALYGWEHAMIHRLGGRPLASALSPELIGQLRASRFPAYSGRAAALLAGGVPVEDHDRFYGGHARAEHAVACGLDPRWPLAGGTGY